MSEIYDRAEQIGHAAEQQRLAHEARQRSTEDAERKVSHRRAKDFAQIMEDHGVAKIALAQTDGYYRIPTLRRLKLGWQTSFVHDFFSNSAGYAYDYPDTVRKEQGHKLSVVGLGWLAMKPYFPPSNDEISGPAISVFVKEDATTFYCYGNTQQSRGEMYVTPTHEGSVGGPLPTPDDRALASEAALEGMAQMLRHLGIKK